LVEAGMQLSEQIDSLSGTGKIQLYLLV